MKIKNKKGKLNKILMLLTSFLVLGIPITSLAKEAKQINTGTYIISANDYEQTETAGNSITLLPSIIEHGNGQFYQIEWYRSDDNAASWSKVHEARGNLPKELGYTYYTDCTQTFSKYKFRMTNEAGTTESGVLTTVIYEKYSISGSTLTIESSGNIKGANDIIAPMNDYTDARWQGRTPLWKNQSFSDVIISDKISTVGQASFRDIQNLKHIFLSNAVDLKTINESSFENSGLLGITIPKSVESIKRFAFKSCNSLRDIRFLGNNTLISEEPGTIPRTRDTLGINGYDIVTDKYNRKHGFPIIYGYSGSTAEAYTNKFNTGTQVDEAGQDIVYGFMPINDSKGTMVEWNYKTKGDTLTNLHTKTVLAGEVWIPKSIDGYLTTEIGNVKNEENSDINMFGGEVLEEGETPSNTSISLDGITKIRIPDSVKNLGKNAITDCPNLTEIYNDYYGTQTTLDSAGNQSDIKSINFIGSNVSEESGNIYLYSTNHTFENSVILKYNRVFYDKILNGITKNTVWSLNMKTKMLTISGHDGTPYTDESFLWATKYIEKIRMESNLTKIEDELFSGLVFVKAITNESDIIESAGFDSFKDVGKSAVGERICTTYVNNIVVDALSNGTKENPFKMVFMTTIASCGPNTINTIPTMFEYNATNGSLKLYSKDGTSSVMKSYTENDIPWRCVKNYITRVEIAKDVTSLSTNSFTKLPKLKEVYNRSTNQIISGSGELFDVIKRYEGNTDSGAGITIMVDSPINYDNLWKQLSAAGFNSITIEDLEATAITPGEHQIYSYMLPSEVLNALSKNTTYIVPVFGYLKENVNFVNCVPQPEEKGYRLESIYLDNGICGENLKWYLYRDGILEIEGSGAMYDYNETDNRAPWHSHRETIRSITMPAKMTRIGSYAFDGLTTIKTVEISTGVTEIGLEAFQNSGLTSFTLPFNVKQIDGALFTGCESLTDFRGSDANYKIIDGILYDRNQIVLVEYLRDKLNNPASGVPYSEINEFTMPQTVKSIAERAFYKNTTLNKIYMEETVKDVGRESFAQMEKLYYLDCKTGKSNPPYLGTEKDHISTQAVNQNALLGSADKYPSREVLIYKSNTDLAKAAEDAGYRIRYYDSMNIDHINANYTGTGVVIGQTIPLKDITFDIVFASGLSESATGEDVRFQIDGNMTVTKIGENKFTATYNDGYTEKIKTEEFSVTGINKITEMSARYNGLDIWYGESFAASNVMISLKYANGDVKTISGENEFINFSDRVINTLKPNSIFGSEEIVVTYDDKQNKVLTDTFKINCSDYVDTISASYVGEETVEATAGINGLSDSVKENISIQIKWKSATTLDTITGNDGSVSFSGGGSVVSDKLQIVVEYSKNNRYEKTAVVNIPCSSNIKDAMFVYTGGPVTKGTTLNLSNITIILSYADGSTQNFKADTVENITVEPMIINNYGVNDVLVTYSPPGFEKSGEIQIMGTIALPTKLIVTQRPKKTVYQSGEVFEKEGLRVNCLYDNGEIQDVSDLVVIENGTNISETTKNVIISYTENRDGQEHVVKTYLSINVNQNQKELTREKTFQETYEIDRILFRSKKTEDTSTVEKETEENTEGDEERGKWTEIPLNDSSQGSNTDLSASIKAGYGFELKVYTKYKTTRGSKEFKDFMDKAQWNKSYDETYASVPEYIAHKEDWNYLNDIYPQHVPTSNPDLMYVRILKRSADKDDQYTQIGSNDFIIMDKTNKDEKNHIISEGEWYNSQKIFEFPLRTVNENGEIVTTDDENGGDRRIYVSRDAAESDSANTEYVVQILSPAWYGYESEPEFDKVSGQFILNDETTGTGIRKSWNNGDMYKYLHVAYEFSMFVQKNDDIHTHILQ